MALAHLHVLRRNDLVVYDRGYFSYVLLYFHIKQGIHAVFRLKKNAYKVIDEFMSSEATDRVVVIIPSITRQQEILAHYPDIDFIPLRLRLIKYVIAETTFTLGTTRVDEALYRTAEFAELYHARWGVGVSGEGHIIQSVKVRPGSKDSGFVAWEAPWRESKTVEPSDPVHLGCTATHQVVT